MTLTPDERHAVAGELRWLARRREQNAVMSPAWLRQRADWIEVSGERRAPAREREFDVTEQIRLLAPGEWDGPSTVTVRRVDLHWEDLPKEDA